MGYLERYLKGEYEQVWAELQALGPAVRTGTIHAEAQQVANETMRRVRRNCERLVAQLTTLGYRFGLYPDGSKPAYAPPPVLPPSEGWQRDIKTLEEAVGPLPISLVAFWEEVGAVRLIGMHPEWHRELDALVVDPPESGVSELDEREYMLEDRGHFEVSLAPDALHKDNVSGGAAYAVKLPEPAMDFLLLNEPHNVLFVPYLRLAILRYGGFPGLEGQTEGLEALPLLLDGLEPF